MGNENSLYLIAKVRKVLVPWWDFLYQCLDS